MKRRGFLASCALMGALALTACGGATATGNTTTGTSTTAIETNINETPTTAVATTASEAPATEAPATAVATTASEAPATTASETSTAVTTTASETSSTAVATTTNETSTATSESPTSGETTITIGTDTDAALKFVPAQVETTANTKVKLVFENKSTSQPHNLAFKQGISAKTATLIMPGKSETLEFTTPAAGTYDFVCTIHPGMEGQLIVK